MEKEKSVRANKIVKANKQRKQRRLEGELEVIRAEIAQLSELIRKGEGE